MRYLLKGSLRLMIECDMDPMRMVIRSSKTELFKLLDRIIPDEAQP